ncbi:MAG: hypothetical protein D6723_10530 [Acidobacteria bacterium]|nr:MAG: hypothetical protein D6723_10530 [Acidobacteriota bacterium]
MERRDRSTAEQRWLESPHGARCHLVLHSSSVLLRKSPQRRRERKDLPTGSFHPLDVARARRGRLLRRGEMRGTRRGLAFILGEQLFN